MRVLGASSALVLLSACLATREGSPGASLEPTALTCEHRVDPLGIDALPPRFGWKLAARDEDARGLAQSAYRVLVASSREALAAEDGDLWDSGRVASSETVDVEYVGRSLGSDAHAWWAVHVWDQDGRPSAWSAPARFSTGLLEPDDWSGEWIGFDAPARRPPVTGPLDGATWIGWEGDGDPAPAGMRYLRAVLDLPSAPRRAWLVLTVDDQWTLFVNGHEAHTSDGEEYAWRRPAELDVAPWLAAGANVLAVRAENTVESPAGLVARLEVELADGTSRVLASDGTWSASAEPGPDWSSPEGARAGGASDEGGAWSPAREIAPYGEGPWGRIEPVPLFLPPTRLLRTEFALPGRPVRATLFSSSLGLHDVELNGRRVGDALFAPGWTDYEQRVLYRAHDVTDLLREGANALGAELADGWYAGYVGYGGRRGHYGERTRFLAELRVELADGATVRVASDGGWRASTGARLEADFLMGEAYDARLAPAGWSSPGFDDSAWSPVDVGAEVAPRLTAHPGPPVRVVREFAPREIWATGEDTWVCDLGQNVAGFVRLRLDAEPGREVVLRHAERLSPDRTIYVENLRGARATDRYVCRGGGPETWEPRFTFHGFQYVEVRGLGRAPRPDEVTGLAVTSDVPFVGTLETSEPALDRLLENVRWTQRMNFIDVPTDCPQRDERLGWTGDAQMYARTAMWNADVHAFFTKWLQDLADAQRDDGQFPMVAPQIVAGDDGGPAWADAGVICPWEAYLAYGDRRLLARQYPSMQRFLDFCEARSGPAGLPPESFHCFGDWVHLDAETPHEVIYTAYLAHSADLMRRSAEALGRASDAARYAELFERVRAAFRSAYVDADGRVRGDTQCGYALALSFGLLDGELRERAARRLVADIDAHGGHFTTGFVGTKDLLLALNAVGRVDVAYDLVLSRDYPSWLFAVGHGATSIWERWDGWTPERGFQDPGMNSFAHYAFGSVGQWMFETIGGLGTDAPGFARLDLAPRPGGGLTRARAVHDSIRGRIEVAWELVGDGLRLDVLVPPNVGATLAIPTRAPDSVTERGRALASAEGVRELGRSDEALRLELASGRYAFTCREPVVAGGR